MNSNPGTAANALNLPKGGGALKGIGETFQPNLFTGTGNYSIPLSTSPGRNGFSPAISLQYSSGNGNGPFGLGWKLSVPRITRKTEKGLPRYDDSDVFVMSGAEDLVPVLKKIVDPDDGRVTWAPEGPVAYESHTAFRYRPRTEGLFARIERWQHNTTGETHWRAVTRNNVTSIYGGTTSSRIANPEDERQVYEWLLLETFDAVGNHILYEYAGDTPALYTDAGESLSLHDIFERNRRPAQLYLRRIYYGNLPDPLLDEQGQAVTYPGGGEVGHLRGGRRYAFEMLFDYGDWDIPTKDPHPSPPSDGQQEMFGPDPSAASGPNAVPVRDDRFSDFRAGFEIRTLRRCRRVLTFHHFAELGNPTLVRSTDFDYRNDPDTLLSFLTAVTVTGYQKSTASDYKSASVPPVSFKYSEFKPYEQRYQSLSAKANDMPPVALDDPNLAMVDLFGDGLPDVLQSTDAGFRYWRNLGGGLLDRPRSMTQIPAGVTLAQHGVGFGDMSGDGRADLLVHSGPLPGFFETTSGGTWQTFRPYATAPAFAPGDANVRLVDLTGNGLSDALLTEGESFLWFECLGEEGFAPPKRIARNRDPDQFPDVFFDDPEGRVRLADMTGDGLADIVLVHNGRIDYWPNLGYGRFGGRITMADAPHLETDFDPRRLFLADLNGTGCADLVYVSFGRVDFWFNRSGNEWSETHTITGTPFVTDVDSIRFADIFGTGTATLVWSYDYSRQPESNYKALDFCGGVKPYVLTEMSNDMGATTRVSYAPSTRYFLEDQAQGSPWVTRLPFPVQVIDRVEVIDHISRTKLVTTYKYHHGHFDGREREFRGFGRVDQFDTEVFEEFTRPGLHGGEHPFDNGNAAYYVPPVETRSWFHTGIYFDEDSAADAYFDYRDLASRFRAEFYGADEAAPPLGAHHVEADEAPREAYRLLRGALLRTEVYARDESVKAAHPYAVTENRYRVRPLQPRHGDNHGVYFSHQLESRTYHYERNPVDPRTTQSLTLDVDAFGNVLKSIAVGYGRRQPDPALTTQADRDAQTQTLITYVQSSYTNPVDDPANEPGDYRAPLPSETRSYELTGFTPAGGAAYFGVEEWARDEFAPLRRAAEIGYEEAADLTQEQKRLIEHVRTYYRKNDLTGLLPLHALESLALPGESYQLALTPELVTKTYGARVAGPVPVAEGGYVHCEGDNNWWVPSGRIFYSPNVSDTPAEELAFARRHFFLPCRARDAFGYSVVTEYDHPYDLLPRRATDALGNRTVAEHDYRLLQPRLVTDPNGNRSEVVFDTLGLVVGTAVQGKSSEAEGDSLAEFEADVTPQQLQDFFADPAGQAESILKGGTTRIVYDLDRFRSARQPPYAATISRETHLNDPSPPGGLKTQISFSYFDGFGREIQKRLLVEPETVAGDGSASSARWVASGWAIFNNKGKPVKEFEPFFEGTHEFRFENQVGVSSTLFYDPPGRIVATLHPDHTWEKVVFGPWRRETWDVNDTVLIADPGADADAGGFFRRLREDTYLPTWYAQRQGDTTGPDGQAAAKTAVHAATPSLSHDDSLGRTFLTVAHNRFEREGALADEKLSTRTTLDIEGNQREVIDARDRAVMRYDYDMLGTRLRQASMEAGERWMLNDVNGRPVYTWDSRDHRLNVKYDELRRPLDTLLTEGASSQPRLVTRTVYGEGRPHPEANNLRGRVFQVSDQAGTITTDEYDFKGNPLSSRRRLAREYGGTLDWLTEPELEPEDDSLTTRTAYDALNRPVAVTAPDGSVCRPEFYQANLLRRVEVGLPGAGQAKTFVGHVEYNAKGQRLRVEYGNGAVTSYDYDPLTFRLTRLLTRRGSERLQDLSYTYDPAGNVTYIRDDAQQEIYFANQAVSPSSDYAYDAVYRLVAARGREHIGQTAFDFQPADGDYRDHPFAGYRLHSNDGQAMRRYTELYTYDRAGNLAQITHTAANNGVWSRSYEYEKPSLLEPDKRSNRLSSTTVGGHAPEPYTYDEHGNVTGMPHLSLMRLDFTDQLQATARQVANDGGPETTYYVYDAAGRRVRKVTEGPGGARRNERVYVGGFEVYREYNNGDVTLERKTLHVMDDTQRVALVETRTDGGPHAPLIRYQFGNHLGSAVLELDGSAQIISYEEYHPYGTTSYQATTDFIEVPPKRYRYTGMERDEENGLSYHGARYYAPWLGRWIRPDPAWLIDSPNLYEYVRGNPTRIKDPSGRQGTEADFSELNMCVAETAQSPEFAAVLDNVPAPIPQAAPGINYASAAKQGAANFRASNVMPPGTQAQHWTKQITSEMCEMPPAIMNTNMSPLQSRNALPATTLLTDPRGGGTRYSVDGGPTFGNEHKLSDRHIIPAEEAKNLPSANPRNAEAEAGQAGRWRVEGESGSGPGRMWRLGRQTPEAPPQPTTPPSPRPSEPAATPQGPRVSAATWFGRVIAGVDIVMSAKAASDQPTIAGKAKEVAATSGRWAGMAYGAAQCAEFGPEGALFCGGLGAIAGETGVRVVTTMPRELPDYYRFRAAENAWRWCEGSRVWDTETGRQIACIVQAQ